MRVDILERTEIAIQKLADYLAKPGFVLRKASGINRVAASFESKSETFDLRALATAIDAFDGDEFSGSGHFQGDRGSISGRKPV